MAAVLQVISLTFNCARSHNMSSASVRFDLSAPSLLVYSEAYRRTDHCCCRNSSLRKRLRTLMRSGCSRMRARKGARAAWANSVRVCCGCSTCLQARSAAAYCTSTSCSNCSSLVAGAFAAYLVVTLRALVRSLRCGTQVRRIPALPREVPLEHACAVPRPRCARSRQAVRVV